jgi:tripartite ATP-independent transporter DctM subunit
MREFVPLTVRALPALLMPVVLLGGIYGGVMTPTESAAVAALYALLISAFLYRSIGWKDVYHSLVNSARVTTSIGMLIAGALVFNFVITSENIPKMVSGVLKAYELSPFMYLLAVNVLLLVLGCFLEGTTIILVILPVLIPAAESLGIDLVHFGVMCIVNIMIGLVTPPYGLLLFMMNKIADVSLRDMVREVMPFLYVMFGALAIIMLVPEVVLFLPKLLGYKGG